MTKEQYMENLDELQKVCVYRRDEITAAISSGSVITNMMVAALKIATDRYMQHVDSLFTAITE